MIKIRKQLSVYVKNCPSELARICQTFHRSGVNILGFTAVDSDDHVVNRFVVDQPEMASELLEQQGMVVVDNRVLTVEFDRRLPDISAIADRLASARINIGYAYYSQNCEADSSRGAFLVMRVNQPRKALRVLLVEESSTAGMVGT